MATIDGSTITVDDQYIINSILHPNDQIVAGFQPNLMPRSIAILPAILFAIYVVGHLLAFIMRAERVNSEVLCAAVSTYLMLGILWAM